MVGNFKLYFFLNEMVKHLWFFWHNVPKRFKLIINKEQVMSISRTCWFLLLNVDVPIVRGQNSMLKLLYHMAISVQFDYICWWCAQYLHCSLDTFQHTAHLQWSTEIIFRISRNDSIITVKSWKHCDKRRNCFSKVVCCGIVKMRLYFT